MALDYFLHEFEYGIFVDLFRMYGELPNHTSLKALKIKISKEVPTNHVRPKILGLMASNDL